jgi:hypothetical protein
MVANRLQNGLINSSIAPWDSRVNCQNIFFQMGLHIFFSNSDRDFLFYLNTKKSQKTLKNATIVYVPFCAKH